MSNRQVAPLVLIEALLLACVACGDSHRTPTSPSTTPTTPASSGAPTARIDIKVDDQSARDAIAALSDVVVDASASSGTGSLTFVIDYGDGFATTTSIAHHSYAAAGNYTVTATVTDGQARKSSDTRQVAVKSLIGSWFEAEYVTKTQRVEIRKLTVTSQDGLTIHGHYEVTGAANRTFAGTLSAPRSARMVMDDGAVLEGNIPERLGDGSTNWILQARGDTVNGERLEFRPIAPDAGPPPDAVLKVQLGNDNPAVPITAVTPIYLDGQSSRGAGLSYFLEFGDGFAASTAQATHVVDAPLGPRSARLTVVDRTGRSDSESFDYGLFALANYLDDVWWFNDGHEFALGFHFSERSGRNYRGTVWSDIADIADVHGSAVAALSGEHDVQIVLPDTGVEFRGTINVSSLSRARMTLVQIGGRNNGRTWSLAYSPGE